MINFLPVLLSRLFPRICLALLVVSAFPPFESLAQPVLIIQDELPQMELLSSYLKEKGNLEVQIVDQGGIPDDLSHYRAVILYIHRTLERKTEDVVIDYTNNGGRLVGLHHSISSGKAENPYFFDFLGIRLDNPKESRNPVEPGGGYGWRDPVTMTLINLFPNHYITSHNVEWDAQVFYRSSDEPSFEQEYPAIILDSTEVYMNHKFTDGREKTVLVGFKYLDDRNGHLFMQDRSVWSKKSGKGEIVYLQPGHSEIEFRNPNFAQMVLNAITWDGSTPSFVTP